MFVVFYIVNLYICVFMTCFKSCCLCDTPMDLWNVRMYICGRGYIYVKLLTRHVSETADCELQGV